MGIKYILPPQNLTKEASYRYEILIRYKRLREKGFSESEALEFLQVKRSTYFSWLKEKKEIVISENSQTCTLCRTNPKTKAKQSRITNTNRPHGFKFKKNLVLR